MGKRRTDWIDCIAGVLIIRMILGHYISYAGLKTSPMFSALDLLFFYMPWFFYKSGMFYRSVENMTEWKVSVLRNTKSLMIPYVFFSMFGIIIGWVYFYLTNDSALKPTFTTIVSNFIGMGCYYWSSPLWFLLTLSLVKIITPPILKYVNIYILLIGSIGMAFSHYYFMNGHYNWLGNMCSGMAFYLIGIISSKRQYKKVWIAISLIVMTLIGFYTPTFVSMFSNTLQNNGCYLLWYPFCISGIILINNLFKFLHSKGLLFPILNTIGKDSMAYYLIHFSLPVLCCKLHLFKTPNGNHWEFLCYLLVTTAVLLPLCAMMLSRTKLRFLIGK